MSRPSTDARAWASFLAFVLMLAAPSGAADRSRVSAAASGRDAAPPARHVKFLTLDDIEIHAGYTPARAERDQRAPVVILLPMYGHDRSSYDPLVPYLHRAGFAVLAIDPRGHGQSVGPADMKLPDRVEERDRKVFAAMYEDVGAAYFWLGDQAEVDLTRFALVGASVGSSVALDYAGRDRSVDVVVCLTPGTRYLGLDSVRHVSRYGDRPLMLVASEPERAAVDELRRRVPKATVRIIPGPLEDATALHGTRMFGKVAGIEREIVDFLVKGVGPPSKHPVVASVKSNVYHEPDSGTVRMIYAENLRWFSSPAEAASRGLRPPKTRTRRRR